MNVLLWIVQAALALLYFAGGAYKMIGFDELAKQFGAIPRAGWAAVGAFEVAGAVLLVVPAAVKRIAHVVPIAAAALAVEAFGLSALYASYSLAPTAANPLVWSVAMGLLAAFVAFGRYARRPRG